MKAEFKTELQNNKLLSLESDWTRVFVAGETIDGRTVVDDWPKSMAKTYDPELYTAVITREHIPYLGNFGMVTQARTGTFRERVALEVKIRPNKRLLELNGEGQGMFTSVWLKNDWPKEGQHYLRGLSVTDEPASVGTEMLKFAARENSFVSAWTEFEGFTFSDDPEGIAIPDQAIEQGVVAGLKKFFFMFNNSFSKKGKVDVSEGDPMTPEEKQQFEALQTTVGNLAAIVTKHFGADPEKKVNPQVPASGSPDTNKPATPAADPAKPVFSSQPAADQPAPAKPDGGQTLADLFSTLTDIKTGNTDIQGRLAQLEAFANNPKGKPTPEITNFSSGDGKNQELDGQGV